MEVQVSPAVLAARAIPLFTGGVKAELAASNKSAPPILLVLRIVMDCGADVCPTV